MILLVDCRERAALGADTRCEWIRNIHQALLGEDRGALVGLERPAGITPPRKRPADARDQGHSSA